LPGLIRELLEDVGLQAPNHYRATELILEFREVGRNGALEIPSPTVIAGAAIALGKVKEIGEDMRR
jgi:hypothetical protein